jgi:hypothetical protein
MHETHNKVMDDPIGSSVMADLIGHLHLSA